MSHFTVAVVIESGTVCDLSFPSGYIQTNFDIGTGGQLRRPVMGKGKGKEWEDQLKSSIKRVSNWTYNFNNIAQKRPADRIHCWKGRSVLIEAKESHGTNISFSQVEQHQEQHLYLHAKDGGLSLVAVCQALSNHRRAWLCHYSDFAYLKENLGRKSLPFSDMPPQLVELERTETPGMGRHWDMETALTTLAAMTPAPLARWSPNMKR